MEVLLARLAVEQTAKRPLFWRVPLRIAYIVSHSYPYSSNGYAVRTHGVASALVQHGHLVVAINRPGRPWDLPGFVDDQFPLQHDIDGVRYLHLPEPSVKGKPLENYLFEAAEALKTFLRIYKPAVVMAASNWENALPAAIAARELGLPFFYEVRGFWEITKASREPGWENTAEFRAYVEKETAVVRAADRVFTLNHFMRDELVRRGVDQGKIELVPNAFGLLPDLSRPPRLTRGEIGCASRYLVGYIGSFSEYEGLEGLVLGCARLRAQGVDLSLLMVGSSNPVGVSGGIDRCPASQRLKSVANEIGFSEHLHLAGRVEPDALADYYSLTDLIVIPRKSLPVCRLVTPVKPLEAAAYGKAIVVSDVAPLREIIEESKAGLTFEADNVEDMAARMGVLLRDDDGRNRLAKAGRDWVRERSWRQVTLPVVQAVKEIEDRRKVTLSEPGAMKGATLASAPRLNNHSVIECLPFDMPKKTALHKLRVASILDTFSHECFAPECELIPITPAGWREQIGDQPIDMLLVESAWNGNNGAWLYRVAKYGAPPGNELSDVIQWAKKKGIPTVFWNKEDPPNFDRFIDRATEFDFIFTTDENCLERYRARSRPETCLAALPFAAQPRIHHPHLAQPRISRASFAGTYYADDYEPRRRAMDMLLRVSARYGLDIFDRMLHVTGKDKERYQFPVDLQPFIRGSLGYDEMVNAYRRYRLALNVNSVADSPTMFSRRVFELTACGTPVVSTVSRGIDLLFGKIVPTVEMEAEAVEVIHRLMNDPVHWLKQSVRGVRHVLGSHTYAHRFARIAAAIGAGDGKPIQPRAIVVVRPGGDGVRFARCMVDQKSKPHEIIVLWQRNEVVPVQTHLEAVRAAGIQAHAFPAENLLPYLRDQHADGVVAICDSRHHYGPGYLLDAFISVTGDVNARASTILPRERFERDASFDEVAKVGMDSLRGHTGSMVMRADNAALLELLTAGASEEFESRDPIMTRAGFDYLPNAQAAAEGAAGVASVDLGD